MGELFYALMVNLNVTVAPSKRAVMTATIKEGGGAQPSQGQEIHTQTHRHLHTETHMHTHVGQGG